MASKRLLSSASNCPVCCSKDIDGASNGIVCLKCGAIWKYDDAVFTVAETNEKLFEVHIIHAPSRPVVVLKNNKMKVVHGKVTLVELDDENLDDEPILE